MAPKRRRTVGDELADLLNTTPKTDVDLDGYDALDNTRAAVLSSDDEEERDERPSHRAPEKGLRMRGELNVDGEEYVGRTTSRKQFKKGGGGSILDALDDDSDADSGSDGDAAGASDDQLMGDDEDDEEQGSEEELDEEDALLEREYEQLRAEEAAAVQGLKTKLVEEREKGAAVRDQRRLWDRMVEMRILLQKSVAGAHRLPRPATQRLATAGDEATADAYDEFAEEAAATLSTSLALMRAVISTNTAVQTAADAVDQGAVYRRAVEPPAEQLEVGASMEARWAALDACHHAVLPYVRHAVDSWQRKATAARGGTGAGTLHALGQSVSLQVSTAMRNAPRQVARTQLQRHAAPARLCEELVHHQPAAGAEGEQQQQEEEDDEGEEGEDKGTGMDARDEETFDDNDFYTQLLKEFVEQAGGAALAQGPKTKHRKLVDRKASKGRKIRYEVHDKLVNFMAPVTTPLPPMAEQLISAQLFGQTAMA